MDKIIISDTSYLIALTKIDKLDVLRGLYHEIRITKEVYQERVRSRTPRLDFNYRSKG